MKSIKAYASLDAHEQLKPFNINRRDVGIFDVNIKILYCGVCHSDIHQVNNDWGFSTYPIVPGHEIVGQVIAVGESVVNFKTGDIVGVGCLVDSCKSCVDCDEDLEQYCNKGIYTYASDDYKNGDITYGGYSQEIVVNHEFVLKIPTNLTLSKVAPLLCAGITTYSPLRHFKVKSGDIVGVIGLGGLGHMAIKFAKAMGCKVFMITTSKDKAHDATKLGADEIIYSNQIADMNKYNSSFDFLINTIPVSHDLNQFIELLKRDGVMSIVGCLNDFKSNLSGFSLINKRRVISGSLIGGIKETQQMLDFCGTHNILPEVELINIDYINHAYERIMKSDVKYRFVIDMTTL
jgi:uncharacterized zinc-type alcohol dehydrogenase-like protein